MKITLLSLIAIFLYSGCAAKSTSMDPQTGIYEAYGMDVLKSSATYNEAVEYCRNLRVDGHSDWRLPTLDESKRTMRMQYDSDCRNGCGQKHWSSDDGMDRTKMVYRTCCRPGGIVPISTASVTCVRKPK